MNFNTNIQEWVNIDNQIKQYLSKIKELRERKVKLEQSLIQHASTNNLTNSIIPINDGKIKFVNSKITSSLTFKYLEQSLEEVIKNKEQLNIIINHIKQNRVSKYITEIKRF